MMDVTNYQIVFSVIALGGWTAALENKVWRPNVSASLVQSSLPTNVCTEIRNKVLPPYVKFPCHKVAQDMELHFLLLNQAIWGKHWEEDVEL